MTARKKVDPWADEMSWATAICAPLNCTVERSIAMYEIAKVKGVGVSLIIYPHKTTAGHHHARVRDNGSQDKAQAERIMDALDTARGLEQPLQDRIRFSCIFSRHFQARKPKRPTEPT